MSAGLNGDLLLAYLAVIGVFFAAPPGPSQLLMISNSLVHGWRRSLATVAGDLTANACQMAAAGLGLAALIGQSAAALSAVKWAGVAYLVWLGVGRLRDAARTPLGPGAEATRHTGRGTLFRQGFFTSATNPKAVVFFAALFPQFIDPGLPVAAQLVVLGAIYLIVDGVLLVAWGAFAARARGRLGVLAGPALHRVAGLGMIAAAGLLAAKELPEARAR